MESREAGLSNNECSASEIIVRPSGASITFRKGETLLQAIREAGLKLCSLCNGLGTCGKCRVVVLKSRMADRPTHSEEQWLSDQELSEGLRLACQISADNAAEIYIPPESQTSSAKIQIKGIVRKMGPLNPAVKKYYVDLPEPSLQNVEPDAERLLKTLSAAGPRQSHLSLPLILNLSKTLREAGWKVTVTILHGTEVLTVEEGDTRYACYGLAIDVGTTKIVGHLIDLSTGQTLVASGIPNPQASYGVDILSRIDYAAVNNIQRQELQTSVICGINELIAELCARSAIDAKYIYQVMLVGNTAMHHLLLGISTAYLGQSPYVPAMKAPINISAREIGIAIQPRANIHFLPIIASFVGSDCVAAILATGLFRQKSTAYSLILGQILK